MNDHQQEVDMLEIHAAAMEDVDSAVHDLLLGYTQDNLIYLFVEGRGDVSFYRQAISAKLKNGWSVKIFPSGSRKKVLRSREDISAHDLDLSKFAFIVDRDFHSVFADETLSEEIYITDGYSIENTLCSGKLLVGVLEAYYGLANITQAEANAIEEHFDEASRRFCEHIAPLTFQMASWRTKGTEVQFTTIKPNSLVAVREDQDLVTGEMSCENLASQCATLKAVQCDDGDISSVREQILGKYDLRQITRGKFVAWFFCKHLEVLPHFFTDVIGAEKKLPKAVVTIGSNNFTAVCGTHASIPETLWRFLNARFPDVSIAIHEELVA